MIVSPRRDSARALIEFLRPEGVHVQVVTSPELAFEEALLHRPSIVLVDERISPAGGVDLCRRLKGNARTHFLPVILFVHGRQSDVFRLDALAAGADAVFCASTGKAERRARLWALLRSQAVFRRLEGRREAQRSAIFDKRRWVRGLVHDIQNSLGAIQANFEYLAQQSGGHDGKSRAEIEECVRETRGTFREMVRNLRTVLEFERFEAGDVVLREDKVLLSKVAEAAASSLGHLAFGLRKAIVVENSLHAAPVRGDEKHLVEAVAGLATFVLRQTENQKCFLQASSDDGVCRLRVYGERHRIPAAARRGIFDPYVGLAKDRNTRAAHRVGLALAKTIVEAHHGAIHIEDTPSAGSAFVVELPTGWPSREQRRSE
ncbi:MAG: hybrid sensor histidine kinase/response regulator [Deltaproteobacteria bacterium]|nr:hybrid sensor histidine kinase/response regulator [Deltaproteobacteria bacterium]